MAAVLGASGCASGTDAVAQGGTFDFVAPGGQTDILYDPPESRGKVGPLSGPDLMAEDRTVSLSDYDGQVVVINLWGQWCAPCRSEADDLEQAYEATRDLGVQFLGINVRDPQRDKAQDFVIDNQVTYPSIYDPPMRTLIALGGSYPTSVIPSTLVLDRQHRVAAVFLRALLAEDLQPILERLAAQQ
ncbi:TlpA disulfide reductase family protein [Rhodococcus sp. IEGM 1351]|uniref:TlpA disulfide reductase family protein n=1 Tax=Rhodococcus sp. IEGM 1351 TaxID=3047089 RepID=UPI0024B7F422|nr:TlpA disulfide reductase family protein [Rhodococcus sp. IEGM 1351]MDI9938909.1 TlpA disulfide reductase family protein [Rhodococcus sp. IEGM 1351]